MLTTSMMSSKLRIEGFQLHCLVADYAKLKIIDQSHLINHFQCLNLEYNTKFVRYRFNKPSVNNRPLETNQGSKRPDICGIHDSQCITPQYRIKLFPKHSNEPQHRSIKKRQRKVHEMIIFLKLQTSYI